MYFLHGPSGSGSKLGRLTAPTGPAGGRRGGGRPHPVSRRAGGAPSPSGPHGAPVPVILAKSAGHGPHSSLQFGLILNELGSQFDGRFRLFVLEAHFHPVMFRPRPTTTVEQGRGTLVRWNFQESGSFVDNSRVACDTLYCYTTELFMISAYIIASGGEIPTNSIDGIPAGFDRKHLPSQGLIVEIITRNNLKLESVSYS